MAHRMVVAGGNYTLPVLEYVPTKKLRLNPPKKRTRI